VSPRKAQAATALAVSSLGVASSLGPTWAGLQPFLPLGPVEWCTLAFISAALAGIWAHGLPQAHRNAITAKLVGR
jgi:hypothetical protein